MRAGYQNLSKSNWTHLKSIYFGDCFDIYSKYNIIEAGTKLNVNDLSILCNNWRQLEQVIANSGEPIFWISFILFGENNTKIKVPEWPQI